MTLRTDVGALAAWAAPPPGPDNGDRGPAMSGVKPTPFRSASFDDVQGAVAAALLLMSAVPHRDGAAPIGIAIALGDPEGARAEADALASRAPPGSILLTPAAVEAIGHRLPDGMALWVESVTTDDGVLTAFALRSATEVMPHFLPVPATRLIGRASELRELRDLLAVQRLVTLAGPPGSGKTRLAVELGRSALGTFADGAWFVPLAPIQDEGLVAHAVARALDLSEIPGTPMSGVVARHLASRRLLLILDNFEHLLGGGAIVAEWLAGAPSLHVLVTSREPLHLSGEWEFDVPPLRVPSNANDPRAAEAEAVQLFTERARAVDASFETDGPTSVTSCRSADAWMDCRWRWSSRRPAPRRSRWRRSWPAWSGAWSCSPAALATSRNDTTRSGRQCRGATTSSRPRSRRSSAASPRSAAAGRSTPPMRSPPRQSSARTPSTSRRPCSTRASSAGTGIRAASRGTTCWR